MKMRESDGEKERGWGTDIQTERQTDRHTDSESTSPANANAIRKHVFSVSKFFYYPFSIIGTRPGRGGTPDQTNVKEKPIANIVIEFGEHCLLEGDVSDGGQL